MRVVRLPQSGVVTPCVGSTSTPAFATPFPCAGERGRLPEGGTARGAETITHKDLASPRLARARLPATPRRKATMEILRHKPAGGGGAHETPHAIDLEGDGAKEDARKHMREDAQGDNEGPHRHVKRGEVLLRTAPPRRRGSGTHSRRVRTSRLPTPSGGRR